MKISPIQAFQVGNQFQVESSVYGQYPLLIKNGFILFRVTGKSGRIAYGFLTLIYPENQSVVRPHENVIPDKVQSKIDEINTEAIFDKPVCLLYKPDKTTTNLIIEGFEKGRIITHLQEEGSLYEYTIYDNAEWANRLICLFKDLGSLVIADGHHRVAAYFKLRNESKQDPGLFSAILSLDQAKIHSYNRKIRMDDRHLDSFITLLRNNYWFYDVSPDQSDGSSEWPGTDDRSILMYHNTQLNRLVPRDSKVPKRTGSADLLKYFESGIINHFCELNAIDIYDVVEFISGSDIYRVAIQLEPGEFLLVFPPVSPEYLWESSHRGEILPAKSTWIEPRIPSDVIQIPNIS